MKSMRIFVPAKIARWLWTNTDSLNKWAQVVALLVAAYWAYTRFVDTQEPSLETRVEISAELSDEAGPSTQSCYVYLNFLLRNSGASSFEVRGMHIQAWKQLFHESLAGHLSI
jgi:hypothetical protein